MNFAGLRGAGGANLSLDGSEIRHVRPPEGMTGAMSVILNLQDYELPGSDDGA